MERIRILLTNGHYPDLYAIKSFLQQSCDPEYEIHHFIDPAKALSFLSENAVDVILSSLGESNVFKEGLEFIDAAQIIAVDTPIIVFCSKLERQINNQIIAAGAEGTISRERFLTHHDDLRNAIDHALARRYKASRNISEAVSLSKINSTSTLSKQQVKAADEFKIMQEEAAMTLLNMQSRAAVELRAVHVSSAISLLVTQAQFAEDLRHAQEQHKADFAKLEAERISQNNDYKQVYFWMHGGYSAEEYLEKGAADSDGRDPGQLKDASELKDAQANAAHNLLESQKLIARNLQDNNAAQAVSLKQAQEKSAGATKETQDEVALCQRWLDD